MSCVQAASRGHAVEDDGGGVVSQSPESVIPPMLGGSEREKQEESGEQHRQSLAGHGWMGGRHWSTRETWLVRMRCGVRRIGVQEC